MVKLILSNKLGSSVVWTIDLPYIFLFFDCRCLHYLNIMFIYLFYTDLKTQLNVKTAEISELKIQLDDAKSSTNREILAQEDLQKHYQHRLKEKQTEIDSFKRCSVPFFQIWVQEYQFWNWYYKYRISLYIIQSFKSDFS